MDFLESKRGMVKQSIAVRRAAFVSLRSVVAATAVATLLAGCSSGTSTPNSTPSASDGSSTPATAPSALDKWDKAYAYLAAQTKPTEIACNRFTTIAGNLSPAKRPARFYDFSAPAAWKSHLLTRNDALPQGTFQICQATVPTTVRYGPAIADFLSPLGLSFAAEPTHPAGLTPIDIAYAGQSASDPDIIYRDKPSLFGLRGALGQLGQAPFEPGTSKIIQPTDDATAAQYLRYATPLLDWYGYKT